MQMSLRAGIQIQGSLAWAIWNCQLSIISDQHWWFYGSTYYYRVLALKGNLESPSDITIHFIRKFSNAVLGGGGGELVKWSIFFPPTIITIINRDII